MIATQRVFRFGVGDVDGDGSMRELLGGKGAGLAEMTTLGVPVPPGFTISTDVCRAYLKNGAVENGLHEDIAEAFEWLEEKGGGGFGTAGDPLLVSVRSGAPVSMPGMMDTILNVGLNDEAVKGLARVSGSGRFAYDSYRRLIQMFGTVVLGVPKEAFDERFRSTMKAESAGADAELSEAALAGLCEEFKEVVQALSGRAFPQEASVQVELAVEAVFRSWRSERACFYRKLNGIADEMGTAVTVQAMVFGNRGKTSGTGVGFTRNPSTGERTTFGEFLFEAQGEDIVAGTRTPLAIAELAEVLPEAYSELTTLTQKLELHYKDVQDFEFSVEEGKLYLLQTRSAKRAATAAVQIAVDMVAEGLISKAEAVQRIAPDSVTEILSPGLDFSQGTPDVLTTGLAASPGSAVGQLALTADQAVEMAAEGMTVVLVTEETTADDIHGMAACAGFLTARGGATSHAAVVARGMGKCCITGAKDVEIHARENVAEIGGKRFKAGDWISIEGSTGRVFAGRLPVKKTAENNEALETLLGWARELGACKVRANADTPEDARVARGWKAAGIGLCRTEHMFFSTERLPDVREMILAKETAGRVVALRKLLPMQQGDFEALFRTMSPLPVTIRLLDPPLHEFLPTLEEIDGEIAAAAGDEAKVLELQAMRRQTALLSESNPMMGHRGCRLSLTYPEILEMQVTAILQAAQKVKDEGLEPGAEIMVPLVSSEQEMRVLARLIRETADKVLAGVANPVEYKIGAMIELPRAAVCAAALAQHLSFVSFGTNDLTQMTYGFSRDDSRTYLDSYLAQGIMKDDPFQTIDQEGVGALVAMAVKAVRGVNPKMKVGVCGEHGGDPRSIRFFNSLGVDYVSCSPARLPVAQIAAAQAGMS